MSDPQAEVRQDKFLCGRLNLWQPVRGYRAATDPVLLAAACPARPGDSVLDLGCGVGAAALCLGVRVPDLALFGLELQADLCALARRNGAENGLTLQAHCGDVRRPPAPLRRDFDQVICNPPYYPRGGTPSPRPERALALQVGEVPLAGWLAAAARRCRPGGWITAIFGSDGLPEVLGALGPGLGSAVVLPLAARQGRAAGRVLLRVRKGGKGAFRLAAPLVLHAGEAHDGDRESYTPRARAILREAAALDVEFDAPS